MKWLGVMIVASSLVSTAASQEQPKREALHRRIAAMIDELVNVDEHDIGYRAAMSGFGFLPVNAEARYVSGWMPQRPLKQSPALRDLICLGVAALPQLLDHLDDGRRTKVRIAGGFSVREDPPEKKEKVDFAQGINWTVRTLSHTSGSHALTVGDLCYLAIGQIVNAAYRTDTRIPCMNVVSSPTRSKSLCKEVRDEWKSLTADKHRELLIAEALRFESSRSAVDRLAFYYPEAFDDVAVKVLRRPAFDFERGDTDKIRDRLCKTKTAEQAKKQFEKFVAKHGEPYRRLILNRLLDDVESGAKWANRIQDKKWHAESKRRREIVSELFGLPKDFTNKDRVEAMQIWSNDSLQSFLEGLTHDERPAVDRAVAEVLSRTKNRYIALACIERLIARGFDKEIMAAVKGWEDEREIIEKLSMTKVHLAVVRKHRDRLRQAIAAGADVNAVDAKGDTPLHLAVASDDESIEILLAARAKRDVVNKAGRMPVHLAIDAEIFDTAKQLVSELAIERDVFVAAFAGKANAVRSALKRDPLLANAKIAKNVTPLMLAAENGDAATIAALLRAGAKVDVADEKHWRPLHRAASLGHDDAVKLLIAAGADVNAEIPDYCERPLSKALAGGHVAVAQRLCNAKANLRFKSHGVNLLSHVAAAAGQRNSLKWLANQGQSFDDANDEGETPLSLAATRGHLEAVSFLLKQRVKVDSRNMFKSTPLHAAIRMGHSRVVQLLVEANADVNAADTYGVTPLVIARNCQEAEIEAILIRLGAKK